MNKLHSAHAPSEPRSQFTVDVYSFRSFSTFVLVALFITLLFFLKQYDTGGWMGSRGKSFKKRRYGTSADQGA